MATSVPGSVQISRVNGMYHSELFIRLSHDRPDTSLRDYFNSMQRGRSVAANTKNRSTGLVNAHCYIFYIFRHW